MSKRQLSNVGEAAGRQELARLTRLWFECNCNGVQPSLGDAKADEHAKDCPYRVAVEKGGGDERKEGQA